jgi:hypothetical protein
MITSASALVRLHPRAAPRAVVTDLPLDAAVPPSGLAGDLDGSVWVITYRPGANPGLDRLRQDRIAGALATYGIHVSWLAAGLASPTQIARTLKTTD